MSRFSILGSIASLFASTFAQPAFHSAYAWNVHQGPPQKGRGNAAAKRAASKRKRRVSAKKVSRRRK